MPTAGAEGCNGDSKGGTRAEFHFLCRKIAAWPYAATEMQLWCWLTNTVSEPDLQHR